MKNKDTGSFPVRSKGNVNLIVIFRFVDLYLLFLSVTDLYQFIPGKALLLTSSLILSYPRTNYGLFAKLILGSLKKFAETNSKMCTIWTALSDTVFIYSGMYRMVRHCYQFRVI